MKLITSGQIRMARAFLRWSIEELAQQSGIGISTIKRIETFDGIPKARIESIQAIYNAFMETGKIRFEDDTCVCVDEESK